MIDKPEGINQVSIDTMLSEILYGCPLPFIITDENGVIVYGNMAFYVLSGYIEKEVICVKRLDEIIRSALENGGHQAHQVQFSTISPVVYLQNLIRRDRSTSPVWTLSFNSADLCDNARYRCYFIMDLNTVGISGMPDWKHMSESLQSLPLSIFQSTPIVMITDADGKIEYVNPRFTELTGYSFEEVRGQKTEILKSSHTVRDEDEKIWDTILAGKEWRGVLMSKKKSGELYPELTSISPIINDEGKITNFLAVKEDIAGLVQYKDRLMQTEKYFSRIKEKMNDVIVACDAEGRFSYVSPSIRQVLGYDPEAMIGRSVLPYIPPEDRDEVINFVQSVIKGGSDNIKEHRFMHANGSYVWMESAGTAIFNGNLSSGAVFNSRDITWRKSAEESLRQSNEKFRNLMDTIASEIYIIQDFKLVYMNKAVEKYSRLSKHEAERLKLKDIVSNIDPSTRRFAIESIQKLISGLPLPEKAEIKVNKADGSFKWLSLRIEMISYEGRPAVMVNAIDITERKIMEEALIESEKRFTNVTNSTLDAIVSTYEDGRIIFWNRSAELLFGYLKDDAIGKHLSMIIPDLSGLKFENAGRGFALAFSDATEDRILLLKGLRKDGREFPIEVLLSGWQEHNHQYRTATIRDITNRVKAEEELRKAQDELENRIQARTRALKKSNESLIAEIYERRQAENELNEMRMQAELYVDLMGHDINNLNQIAMGYLELAEELLTLDEEKRDLIARPIEALKNSSRLIENVKKLQHIRTTKRQLIEIDLGEILENVRTEYSGMAGKNVTINYVPVAGLKVRANELLIDVFSNLIGNAIKHCNNEPVITIRVTETRHDGVRFYRIAVEDNGPGIKDEQKEIVFNRLQRGQTKAKGSGIGLHLVKTLVTEFGGKVWIEDILPGEITKGSRFVVLLPAA